MKYFPASKVKRKLITSGLILTMDENGSVFNQGDMLIHGNRIEKIAPYIERDDIDLIIDARDKLVIPGLINSHLHSYENLFRGLAPNLPNEIWNLYIYPPLGKLKFPPRLYYLRAILGGIEMLKHGVTSIQDNSSAWFTSNNRSIEEAYWNAYRDLGVRASIAIGLIDRSWLDSLPGLDTLLSQEIIAKLSNSSTDLWLPEDANRAIKRIERIIQEKHNPLDLFTVAIAPSAPQRCSPELLQLSMEVAEKYDLGFHTHVLESRIQSKIGKALYGKSIIQYMKDLGLLKPRTSLVHAVWVSDYDIELIAESGSSIVHCPTSNLRLGSGIMPYQKLKAAGIPIGLGADGAASSDSQDMFDIMYVAALIHTGCYSNYRDWPSSNDILRMATTNNARCIWRQKHLGCLTPGMLADCVLLDLKHLAFTPLHNVQNQLVYSKPSRAVSMVMIDGEIVVENGHLTLIDEDNLLEEVRDYQDFIKSNIEDAQEESLVLLPYLNRLYEILTDQE